MSADLNGEAKPPFMLDGKQIHFSPHLKSRALFDLKVGF
jgi:hypothetical protein